MVISALKCGKEINTATILGMMKMLGLISAITMPDNRPCLKWIRMGKKR